MGLDKANIFKLSKEEFSKYKKDPFLDCFESTKDFAKALKNDIDTKETPHSLLLSADYGMGKIFFSTRFTQYLRNNRYDVIYFSVWENDYMQEPFLAFSKAIINYIHNKFKAEKYKGNIAKVFETTEKMVESITLSTGLGFNISSEKLINAFKAKKDPIIEFRKQLASFINKIPKKKLIIIVDELDRCRPDYAMKTLECIKHFFDIEGLFVILPTNKEALNDCIKSLYGIDNTNRKCRENYFQKFFNDERTIKMPSKEDYIYAVNQYLTEDRVKDALNKKLLVNTYNTYNSLPDLILHFANYSHNACLTIRELKDFSMELARICNNFYEPIRTEWLACIFANKNIKKDNDIFPLPREHCFYRENYKDIENSKNGKNTIFELSIYTSAYEKFNKCESYYFHNYREQYGMYIDFINNYKDIPNNFKTYLEVNKFLETVLAKIERIENFKNMPNMVIGNMKILKQGIIKQKELIAQYQEKYGSDDNDSIRMKNYIAIVTNPELLYSTTCQ